MWVALRASAYFVFALILTCAGTLKALADDTDIYLNSSSTSSAPYLMLTMDYRSDLSATFCNRDCSLVLADHPDLLANLNKYRGTGKATNLHALLAVLDTVFAKFSGINVGLMIPNDSKGGTILRGFKMFEAGDTNGAKQELLDILSSIPIVTGGAYHGTFPMDMHYELYAYLNGLDVEYGDQTSGNFGSTPSSPPSIDYDSSIIQGNKYKSPFASNPSSFECTKLYEVYATSGNTSGQDKWLSSEIAAAMNGASSYTEMVDYVTHNDILTSVPGTQTLKAWYIQMGNSASSTDDWAEAASDSANTNDQFMVVGGNSADLFDVQAKLEAAFVEALSVSTTFVAASVPVNVFNRIQTLDNFYIALFEADSNTRWNGNLKKLKMKDTDGDGTFDDIIDAVDQSAFSNEDGRIKYEALTFWTDQSALPTADAQENEVTDRDGRSVTRGGAGQKIPGFISGGIGDTSALGTRQLYLEPLIGTTLTPFDANLVNAVSWESELNAVSAAESLEIIKWVRGQDADDEDGDGNYTEPRSWLMGDAIHSRPLAINYGATSGYSESNPNIRLFMGTNDGIFHIFENTTTGGAESGEELWGFIPRELMGNFKTLKDNTSADHLYGVDGEAVTLVRDDDGDGTIENGDDVFVYFGLRRGGKSYYALDASDPNSTPTLLWKITKSGDFSELGMTFSTPRVTQIRYGGQTKDVLIFAGGYDTNKDWTSGNDDGNRYGDTEGNAIYIVDADNGSLIWKVVGDSTTSNVSNEKYTHADMDFAIPSSVTVLDSNRNSITDRVYVGDLGGQVWRIDLPEGDSNDSNHRLDNWKATVLADMSNAADSDDIRFFHRPDVVQTQNAAGTKYDAVVIGSGDRANPLETTDENHLFVIKDYAIASGNAGNTVIDDGDLADVTNCPTGCSLLDYSKGWRMEFTGSGEKGLSSPLVGEGKIFYTTYIPNSGTSGSSCEPAEGSGRLYIANFADGTEAFSNSLGLDIGPGIPASAISLSGDLVLIPGTGIDNLPADVDIEGDGKLVKVGSKSMWILYWHEKGTDNL